jgi:hypothetical protein
MTMIFNETYFRELMEKINSINNDIQDIKNASKFSAPEKWTDKQGIFQRYKIAPRTLANYKKQGLVNTYRIGGKLLYKIEEFEQVLKDSSSRKC